MRILSVFALLLSSAPCLWIAQAAAGASTPREAIDRGLIARAVGDGQVYLGWRLLASAPAGVAFNVYRQQADKPAIKLNAEPIRQTTDFVDSAAPQEGECSWLVRSVVDGQEGPAVSTPPVKDSPSNLPYVSIRLDGDHTFQKVGIADLDGDGRYDYVIKQPNFNTDPYYKPGYWKKSEDTYKLEAYRADGKFLWRHDLGWSIEEGIWYSPYLVYDLDGDGKAEVAVKTGEGDPRDKDGRVWSGPEYLTILDGQTGKPIARIDWPSRDGFAEGRSELDAYNYAARNQLSVAYLDGKTPSLIVQRGTYNIMKTIAYQYRDGKLAELWRWDNTSAGKTY